jgi:hypothetical protein
MESLSMPSLPSEYLYDSRASMILFQTPSLSHRLSLLFAVELSQYSFGRSFQGLLIFRT